MSRPALRLPALCLLALPVLTVALTACGSDGVTTDDRVYAPADDEHVVDVDDEGPTDEPTDGEDVPSSTPPPDGCGPGLCLSEEDAAALGANASALASCEAVEPHDFEDTGTVVISQLDLVEQEDGGWALAVAIADPSGRGAYDYPGFSVETLDGAEVLLSSFEQEGAPADRMEHQGYGVSGCDPFGATFPLALAGGEEVKLKVVAWHDIGDTIVDEITFSLHLP